jgi:hypothetical protein
MFTAVSRPTAGQRQLEAAPQAGARDRGDGRLGAAFEAVDQREEIRLGDHLGRIEFLHIGAAGEEFLSADEDDRLDSGIRFRLGELDGDALSHGVRQSVDRGIIELDDGYVAVRG